MYRSLLIFCLLGADLSCLALDHPLQVWPQGTKQGYDFKETSWFSLPSSLEDNYTFSFNIESAHLKLESGNSDIVGIKVKGLKKDLKDLTVIFNKKGFYLHSLRRQVSVNTSSKSSSAKTDTSISFPITSTGGSFQISNVCQEAGSSMSIQGCSSIKIDSFNQATGASLKIKGNNNDLDLRSISQAAGASLSITSGKIYRESSPKRLTIYIYMPRTLPNSGYILHTHEESHCSINNLSAKEINFTLKGVSKIRAKNLDVERAKLTLKNNATGKLCPIKASLLDLNLWNHSQLNLQGGINKLNVKGRGFSKLTSKAEQGVDTLWVSMKHHAVAHLDSSVTMASGKISDNADLTIQTLLSASAIKQKNKAKITVATISG